MDFLTYGIIATFILLYGAVSKRLASTCITGPMLFVLFGYFLGKDTTALFTSRAHMLVYITANITLILILFSDASRINLSLFRKEYDLPQRLLSIGLPLTIALGTVTGAYFVLHLPFWQAAVLATTLAPTDAALAQAVINLKTVPERIREAINVESGLNDGICFPILLMFLSLADPEIPTSSFAYWTAFISFQLVLGPLIGGVIGYLGGKLVNKATQRKWMSENFQHLSIIALSFMAFCFADFLGGNGFIAAFFAGLIFGYVTKRILKPISEFGESVSKLFILLTFLLFGAILVPEAITHFSYPALIYALISLTVIRILPVAISLIGKKLPPYSRLYIGWFGPRGAASILYLLLVVERYNLSYESTIFEVTTLTVLLSVFLHGLSAVWASDRYSESLSINS